MKRTRVIARTYRRCQLCGTERGRNHTLLQRGKEPQVLWTCDVCDLVGVSQ